MGDKRRAGKCREDSEVENNRVSKGSYTTGYSCIDWWGLHKLTSESKIPGGDWSWLWGSYKVVGDSFHEGNYQPWSWAVFVECQQVHISTQSELRNYSQSSEVF